MTQFTSGTIYKPVLLLEMYTQDQKLVGQGSDDLRKEKKVSRAIVKCG